jgi:hypothetical protein
MHALKGDAGYAHRDGRPYPPAVATKDR